MNSFLQCKYTEMIFQMDMEDSWCLGMLYLYCFCVGTVPCSIIAYMYMYIMRYAPL